MVQKLQLRNPHLFTVRCSSYAYAKSSSPAAHSRGLIHGACHTYVGQEAIATGVCSHLREDDVYFQHPSRSWTRAGQRPSSG